VLDCEILEELSQSYCDAVTERLQSDIIANDYRAIAE
jgi:hypothetical protein